MRGGRGVVGGLLFGVLLLLLTACPPGVGSLQVDITGLPGGVSASVIVSGPGGFAQVLAASQTLTNLAPGGYTVTSIDVSASAGSIETTATTYTAVVTGSPATVTPGGTATVGVAYSSVSGDLQVGITGLPSGVDASVTVGGPNGFAASLTASTVLSDLLPGDYVVTASNVSFGSVTFSPEPVARTIVVSAGGSATVTVTYRDSTHGDLDIVVSGLPGSLSADIDISGPAGFSESVTGSTTFKDLIPGNYTITAASLNSSPYSYAPLETDQLVTVGAGETATAKVRYSATTGAASFIVTGLPGGASADIEFALLGSASSTNIAFSSTKGNLEPGSYSITVNPVDFDVFHFEGEVFADTLEVRAGETTTVFLNYRPTDGKLLFASEGLPSGTVVTIGFLKVPTPLPSFGLLLKTDTIITGLAPGSYTFNTVIPEVGVNDITYQLTGLPSSVEVRAGEVTTIDISYIPIDGKLVIRTQGLPAGVKPNIRVKFGSSFDEFVERGTILTHLEPGRYNFSDPTTPIVDDGGLTYVALDWPDSKFVLAGETTTVTIRYQLVVVGP